MLAFLILFLLIVDEAAVPLDLVLDLFLHFVSLFAFVNLIESVGRDLAHNFSVEDGLEWDAHFLNVDVYDAVFERSSFI